MTADHRALLVDRARAAYDAYNRRDWDGFFARLDPEYEFVPVEEGIAYRGREDVFSYFQRWLGAWDQFVIEVEETEMTPDASRIFVALRYRGTAHGGGPTVEGRFFHVGDVRESSYVRTTEYRDETEARRAAGLPAA
jgi:ketosteroid isomerase-like protein